MKGGLCGGHRSLHVDNQVPRTSVCVQLLYLGTLRKEPQESSIKLREYDRFKGFNGTVELQWGSMTSMRLKGFKGFNDFKEVQRCRTVSSDWDREVLRLRNWMGSAWCCRNATDSLRVLQNYNNTIGEIDRGVAEMQHPFCMALQCVAQRSTATQYLVWKKTNNFNDLTVKIRLTAVVMPLHIVASSD